VLTVGRELCTGWWMTLPGRCSTGWVISTGRARRLIFAEDIGRCLALGRAGRTGFTASNFSFHSPCLILFVSKGSGLLPSCFRLTRFSRRSPGTPRSGGCRLRRFFRLELALRYARGHSGVLAVVKTWPFGNLNTLCRSFRTSFPPCSSINRSSVVFGSAIRTPVVACTT
jgi:hypothetical protein